MFSVYTICTPKGSIELALGDGVGVTLLSLDVASFVVTCRAEVNVDGALELGYSTVGSGGSELDVSEGSGSGLCCLGGERTELHGLSSRSEGGNRVRGVAQGFVGAGKVKEVKSPREGVELVE